MADQRSGHDRRETARGGRRRADRPHGTRARYQGGCACVPCKAAEAAYRASLRQLRAKGKPLWGSHVQAGPMWRQIKSLRIEGVSYGEMARRLGLQYPQIRLHHERVTLKSLLKVRALYRRIMDEGIA